MADAKIIVDISRAKKKLSEDSMRRGKVAVANQMLLDMDQYIPKKSGSLRASGKVEGSGNAVTFNTVYARAQFYGTNGIVTFGRYTEPGTGKRWDDKAKDNHLEGWVDKFIEGAKLK